MNSPFIESNGSNERNVLAAMLILLVFCAPLVRYATGSLQYMIVFVIMMASAVALLLTNYSFKRNVYFVATLLLAISFFKFFTHSEGWGPVYYIVVSFGGFVLAYWIAKENTKRVSRIAFIALSVFYVFFIYSMFVHGYKPNDVNDYLNQSSRNIVSALALFYQSLYSASYYRANNRLPRITPLITCVVAFIAYGRSGIALSVALLLFTYVLEFIRAKPIYRLYGGLLFILFIVSVVFNYAILIELIYTQTNFAQGLETPRVIMIQQYWNSLGWFQWFAGQDLASIPKISDYGNNPHNSIIYGHAQYGMLYLIFLCWLVFVFFVAFFSLKRTFVYLGLLSLLMVRITLDTFALPGVFDIFIFYIIMLIILDSNVDFTFKRCEAE